MMRTRNSWLWILLGFSIGCSGGNSTAPGFGTPCSTDQQCAAVGLVCGAAQRCVECLADTDCHSDETCTSSGQCKARASAGCSSSADCTTGTVCDVASGSCVQCLANGDCESGQICVDQMCAAATACSTSSDCPSGLVCDAGLGTCVQCVVDRDCAGGEVCMAHACALDTGTGGAGGATGLGGTGGQSSGGTGGATGGTGGTGGATGGTGGTTGGTGGMGGSTGGTGGTGGTGATGGTGGGCNCSGGLECTTEGCSDPNIIDNFSTCDLNITPVRSRHGQWYAAADTGINETFAVGVPGSAWSDRSCSAWTTGGPTGSGTTNWAVLGVVIADGSAYDLRAYSGVSVLLESGGRVQVIVKTADGGYFANWAASTSGSQTRNIAFSSMYAMDNSSTSYLDLSKVIEFQFSPEFPDTGFGYAVHRLSLY